MIGIKKISKATELLKPRRVMRHVLVWCSSGCATIVVDENEFILNSNTVITITSGQVHYFKNLKETEGYVLEFTFAFFCRDDKDIELIFHNGLFCHFAMNEIIAINKSIIENQLNSISEELDVKPYQYLISVHSRIELILVEINRTKVKRGDEIWKPDALLLKFLEAVRANFSKNFSVKQISDLLATSESKLNELSKLHAGKTAQNVIYDLIVSEAKRLLTYENLSVKEVAYQLGFNDPFYFSNFFKKQTKQSPKLYKDQFSF